MNVLAKLLAVAAAPEVRTDTELHGRVLAALHRIAVDVTEPAGVTPGLGTVVDPSVTLDDHKDDILTLFEGLNSKDSLMTAAIAIPTAVASLLRQIEILRDGIPAAAEGEEVKDGLEAFRTSLDEVHEKVSELTSWANKIAEVAQVKPEVQAPKFPKMPRSVKPSPKLDEDKLPVIEKTEEEPEEAETAPEDETSLEDIAATLQGS